MKRNWFVDGLPLDDPDNRWNLLLSSAPASPAKRRVGELTLPNRSGVITKKQGWGTGLQRFQFVLRGADVEANADVLVGALARAETLVAQVGDRMREARVIDVTLSEPERVFIDYWRLECVLSLQPFWREATTLTSPVMSPGSVTFDQWAGSTGDVQDGVLRVKGPLTRCSITGVGGVSFERALTAAQYVYIDVAAFRAWYSTSASAWTPTSTPVLLDYPAAGPLVLEPSTAGIAVSMSGDGFVTTGTAAETTGITLRGGRYWL